ncbi:hypothetical protein V8C26DRAFT_355983 [Trichoderma gracile]
MPTNRLGPGLHRWKGQCKTKQPPKEKRQKKKRAEAETRRPRQTPARIKHAQRQDAAPWQPSPGWKTTGVNVTTTGQLSWRGLRNLGSAVTSSAATLSSNCFFGDATHDGLSSMEAATIISSVVDWCGGFSAVMVLHQHADERWHITVPPNCGAHMRAALQALRRNQTLHAACII